MQNILVLNSGSSSLKYQLFDVDGDNYQVIAKGLAERIGIDGSKVSIKYADGTKKEVVSPLPSHNEALQEVFGLLLAGAIKDLSEIAAVGHRVVHGGEVFKESVVIDENAIKTIEDLSSLAPLHNPVAVLGLRAVEKALPNVKQVAVFDTAFHQTMPKEAFLYGLPLEQYTRHQHKIILLTALKDTWSFHIVGRRDFLEYLTVRKRNKSIHFLVHDCNIAVSPTAVQKIDRAVIILEKMRINGLCPVMKAIHKGAIHQSTKRSDRRV